MEIAHSLAEVCVDISQGTCVTWGNFDGVHLGHQKLLTHLCRKASAFGLKSVLISFSPHPLHVLGSAPSIITCLHTRLELIAKLGVDLTLVLPFTMELASLEPEDFVHKMFASGLQTKQVVLGYSSFFGKGRRGSASLLSRMGKDLGFEVEQLSPVLLNGAVVSSTRVRRHIAAGDMPGVTALLGRKHIVGGVVRVGRKMGQKLGFPTLNIHPPEDMNFLGLGYDALCGMLPAQGVYAVWAEYKGEFFRAVASVGTNPTFESSLGSLPIGLEVHILDFSKDLYGEFVRIHFVDRLRGQQCFASPEELKIQIRKDIEKTKKIV